MFSIHRFAIAALAAALLGVGCSSTFPWFQFGSKTTATIPPRVAERNLDPEDAWQTYTSKDGSFSFIYPTKGRLAPTWTVSILSEDDPKLDDKGCYRDDPNEQKLKPLDTAGGSFCHTQSVGAAAGNQYWRDDYVTTISGTIILVTFTKHTTTGDNYVDEACHGKFIIDGGEEACIGMIGSDYHAYLDRILETFRVKE